GPSSVSACVQVGRGAHNAAADRYFSTSRGAAVGPQEQGAVEHPGNSATVWWSYRGGDGGRGEGEGRTPGSPGCGHRVREVDFPPGQWRLKPQPAVKSFVKSFTNVLVKERAAGTGPAALFSVGVAGGRSGGGLRRGFLAASQGLGSDG